MCEAGQAHWSEPQVQGGGGHLGRSRGRLNAAERNQTFRPEGPEHEPPVLCGLHEILFVLRMTLFDLHLLI